ncbi:MAG TPA: MBOAT family O-acyltransferase [Blastocatellia bacterium]|nr:MBOAT family O-acyltransferase [Blastocatellia bacterium]
MRLTDGSYFVFLIAVFFAYLVVVDRLRWRVWLLVAASYLFYWRTGPLPVAVLFGVSAFGYLLARCMGAPHDASQSASRSDVEIEPAIRQSFFATLRLCEQRFLPGRQGRAKTQRRKALLILVLFVDVAVLCVFKYANFFLENTASGFALAGIRLPSALNWVAPIGISFFIFQSIAYVVDVYRGDEEPARSFLDYLAFVSFFPTIVAGPILRARDLLPQLRGRIRLDAECGGRALFLIAIGLIKKIAIADYLSANLVDRVFDFPDRFSSLEALAAAYAYALQIYADFSGYSDIAIGSALLLGFKLPENFDAPYRARNLAEFWRRWHISLSTWLRDYVFFAIAGRRARSGFVLYFSVIVTMLIGGLWHGAAWNFVVWGLLHGIGLAAVRVTERLRKKRRESVELRSRPLIGVIRAGMAAFAGVRGAIAGFITFHFVCLTWVVFRADGIAPALSLVKTIGNGTWSMANLPAGALVVMALGFASHFIPNRLFDNTRNGFVRLPSFAQASILFGLCVGLYAVASSDVMPFIYARF